MTQAFSDQPLSAEFVRVAARTAAREKIRVRKNKKGPDFCRALWRSANRLGFQMLPISPVS
jgi:hypothetical protein